MGSKGDTPRKPGHHLPPVGSPANREYELRQRRRAVFRGWPVWLAAALLVVVFASWLVLTL